MDAHEVQARRDDVLAVALRAARRARAVLGVGVAPAAVAVVARAASAPAAAHPVAVAVAEAERRAALARPGVLPHALGVADVVLEAAENADQGGAVRRDRVALVEVAGALDGAGAIAVLARFGRAEGDELPAAGRVDLAEDRGRGATERVADDVVVGARVDAVAPAGGGSRKKEGGRRDINR